MLESEFERAVTRLGGKGDFQAAWLALLGAYRSPGGPRPYHNMDHVRATVATASQLWAGQTEALDARITLALFYHDAIYDSRAKDNEERSAEMARGELGRLGVSGEALDEIARLILLTKSHAVEEGDLAGAMVVDADLAVLQTLPDEYDRYAAAIREEYAWVPEEEYRVWRTKVLEGLMSWRLFVSPLLDEEAARANMRREIEALR